MPFEIPLLPVLSILFLATLIRAMFGFGDAVIGMPLLALVIPVQVATPVMGFVGPTISILLLIKEWRHVELKSATTLIISTLAGIPFGLFFLKHISENIMNTVLAVIIIVFSLHSLVRPMLFRSKSDCVAVPFGFVAGILGSAYNTNGPPVVLYGMMKGWEPESFRATLQGYFLTTGGTILIAQGLAGLWTKTVMITYIYAIPLVCLAIITGTIFGRKIPREKFNRYIYALLLMVGIVLLIKGIR